MVTQMSGENRTKMIHLCQVLLNYGASPNLVPSNQIGVLDVVVENGDMELIKVRVKWRRGLVTQTGSAV